MENKSISATACVYDGFQNSVQPTGINCDLTVQH